MVDITVGSLSGFKGKEDIERTMRRARVTTSIMLALMVISAVASAASPIFLGLTMTLAAYLITGEVALRTYRMQLDLSELIERNGCKCAKKKEGKA